MSKEASLVQLRAIKNSSLRPRLLRISDESVTSPALRAFPVASRVPTLPVAIPDKLLDLYAFRFCQRGFHLIGMTFEQFLLVVTTTDMPAT